MLAAVTWDSVTQAQHLFARKLAARGINVVFVEPLPHRFPRLDEVGKAFQRVRRALTYGARQAADSSPANLHVIRTLGLPETFHSTRSLNNRWFVPRLQKRIQRLSSPPVVVECWKPLAGYLDLVRSLSPELTVYSCIENYPFQYGAPAHFMEVEEALLAEADLVVANSDYVAERLRATRREVRVRDAAVDFELFDRAAVGPVTQARRLCYFGVVSDRLDFEILRGLAAAGYEVLLLGPVKRAPIDPDAPPPNIQCHHRVPIEDVPRIIADSDCILLPYVVDEYTKGIRFAKLYECMATGKPILATPIPTLERYPKLVHVAEDLAGFLNVLETLPDLEDEALYEERRRVARNHTWDDLLDEEIAWLGRGLRDV